MIGPHPFMHSHLSRLGLAECGFTRGGCALHLCCDLLCLHARVLPLCWCRIPPVLQHPHWVLCVRHPIWTNWWSGSSKYCSNKSYCALHLILQQAANTLH